MTPKLIKTLEEIGLDWIEEPFMPDTIEETIKFKEKTNIPIAGGEVLATRWDFKQLLESDSVDIWQPDVSVLGGITEWNKIMNLALLWDMPVAPHAVHEIHVHLAAACPGSQIFTL
jgi:L-alanine-DL-glutamate epimerase-like enolase superfamily enzyme